MIVDTIIEDSRWNEIDLERLAERAAAAAFDHLKIEIESAEISLIGCDDVRIGALNADFRGNDKATNVLSWPSEERRAEIEGEHPALPTDPVLGDIAISYDTCAAEADVAAIALQDHATHLVIHATLHLLGFDHENDADATLMESIEIAVLGKLGISNPYSID